MQAALRLFLLFIFTVANSLYSYIDWYSIYRNVAQRNASYGQYITFGGPIKSIDYNTNFDWEYYVYHNNLKGIGSEQEAYSHYCQYGKAQNLPYCKSFSMLIVLHLFEMHLIDWLIDKTNLFIKNNNMNSYAIKITIPVDTNIYKFNPVHDSTVAIPPDVLQQVRAMTPYHSRLINQMNAPLLYRIAGYLKNHLNIAQDKIQIIFSENRGVDIGGFFLALDQIVKQKQPHDFLVKFHSKADNGWRIGMTLFLELKVNKILNYYDCFYTSHIHFPDISFRCELIRGSEPRVWYLQKLFGLSDIREFDFAHGTMFIASSKFTQFVSSWNFVRCFNMLNMGHNYNHENAFERLFGCIFHKLKLKSYYFKTYYPGTSPPEIPAEHKRPSPFEV